MKVRYVEHRPDEWLVGVAGLTPEQNGIYRTVCDLIASTGGPIPIDDERLFRIIKARPSRIKRVINELLASHKLVIDDSKMSNKRVINELERANKRVINGSKLASKRWNINDLSDADRNARARKLKTKTKTKTKNERVEAPQPRRGTRLPTDFKVPQDWIRIGAECRAEASLPPINLDAEAAKFVDYWNAKAGKDGTKTDWLATWRNWCRIARATPSNWSVAINGHDSGFHTGPTEPPPTFEGFEFRTEKPH
jgi:uncharacterized protein YdaU (DUF1376 family)